MFNRIPTQFISQEDRLAFLAKKASWLTPQPGPAVRPSDLAQRLQAMNPLRYARGRNYVDGPVSRLSAHIRHGQVDPADLDRLSAGFDPDSIEKWNQELAWRSFWHHVLTHHPEWAWEDAEPIKTGWPISQYSDELPPDIASGQTGVACLDHWIKELTETGYIHNHVRMYLAAYVVHWRHVKWQAGAAWFLSVLVDADIASNNLSWQWVASTFSNKPYFFNLENVQKYAPETVDTRPQSNYVLDASYDTLRSRLFPNGVSHE